MSGRRGSAPYRVEMARGYAHPGKIGFYRLLPPFTAFLWGRGLGAGGGSGFRKKYFYEGGAAEQCAVPPAVVKSTMAGKEAGAPKVKGKDCVVTIFGAN
jgi:hypothetical protein